MNKSAFQKHHQPHPCQFCGQGAGYSPIPEMETHGVSVYFCYPCRAEYLVYWDGPQASVSLYTEINGKMFRWTKTNAGSGTISHIVDPGEPGVRKNGKVETVKHFQASKDPLPNVTPQNVNEKLRTWLLFL